MKDSWRRLLLIILPYIIGIFLLLVTNPEKLPLPLLIVPFGYLLFTLFFTLRFMLGRQYQKKTFRIITLVLAIVPVVILVLSSINQLSSKDVILYIAITVILVVYLVKIKP